MKYEVIWSETSIKSLESFSKEVTNHILKKIESIRDDPFRFTKKLKGFPFRSLRVGDYRVIMSLEKVMIIFVIQVGHRKKVYADY